MRFCEYLRNTVLLLGATSVALLVIALNTIVREDSLPMLIFAIGWIPVSLLVGLWIGRGSGASESIRRLLSRSRPEPIFPKIEPGAVMLSRMWLVLLIAIGAAVAAFWTASPAIVCAGYGLIWALAWRKQALAVEAIEERDAVHFWIVRTIFQATETGASPGDVGRGHALGFRNR